jgi:hypothetical protein
MILGANGDDRIALNQGSASMYVRRNGAWAFETELLADDGMPEDHFGIHVAIQGDRAIVGAIRADGPSANSGAVYVFEFATSGWVQTAKLTPPAGLDGGGLGFSVDLQGDTIVAGAPGADGTGAVHVFQFDGIAWAHVQKLSPLDGSDGDNFGFAVALDGSTLVVGSPRAGEPGDRGGACYVYELVDAQWTQVQKLRPTAIDDSDQFGWGVSIDADSIAAGAPSFAEGATGVVQPGAAFVYSRVAGIWTEQTMLVSEDPDTYYFGAVTIEGDTAVVGAQWDREFGIQAGAAFVFDRQDGVWNKSTKLLASDAGTNQLFGHNLDIDNGTIACASAWAPVDGILRAGAAYIFEPNPCPADLDADGELTIFDFLEFGNLFDLMDPRADFDGDGNFTLFDFLAFQNAFDAGCP